MTCVSSFKLIYFTRTHVKQHAALNLSGREEVGQRSLSGCPLQGVEVMVKSSHDGKRKVTLIPEAS